MKKLLIATVVLCLALSNGAFGQSSNATVSGSVSDSYGAVLPGVSVTAANIGTGVVATVLSNESGVYNLASLLPGTYRVSAELPGFRRGHTQMSSWGSLMGGIKTSWNPGSQGCP